MKTICRNLLITLAALFVFGLVTGQLYELDELLVNHVHSEKVVVYHEPISTYNLGR